jgi:hypothetical protein
LILIWQPKYSVVEAASGIGPAPELTAHLLMGRARANQAEPVA